jgi:Ca2+/Na+ antiporter
MAVVGSASFNLLIVSGLSIAAVTEVKRILNMNVFLVMAAFAAFAYVWLFLVLVVISPGEIDFAEAMVTLMFYPALLVSAWVSEYLSPEERAEAEELEHNRRLVCKQNIVDAAAAQGSFAVVDLVTGASDSFEAETLRADFKICLGVEDLKDATIDELLNVIDPECPVARLALRKASKTVSEVAPVAQSDAEAQQ